MPTTDTWSFFGDRLNFIDTKYFHNKHFTKLIAPWHTRKKNGLDAIISI